MKNKEAEPRVIQFPKRSTANVPEQGEGSVTVLTQWKYRNHPSVVRDER
jgi:hypothetical protein